MNCILVKKLSVLIVDDNAKFRKALRFLIENSFSDRISELREACNGEEAIQMVQTRKTDLIFMDADMPIRSGIEATRELTCKYRYLVIIAVSFHSEFSYIKQMIEAGAHNYITKEEIDTDAIKRVFENYKTPA